MKKGQAVQQPEAPTLVLSTLLQLIDQEQRDDGWTDDDLEQHLGVEGLGLMKLMRMGVVQMAYRSVVDIEQKMHANVLAVLQALIRSHIGCDRLHSGDSYSAVDRPRLFPARQNTSRRGEWRDSDLIVENAACNGMGGAQCSDEAHGRIGHLTTPERSKPVGMRILHPLC